MESGAPRRGLGGPILEGGGERSGRSSPELIAAAVPLVRHGRPIWESEPPLAKLASAAFPKLVVSGGHSAGLDAICDDLAERIGAFRMVVKGAGHEIQFTGRPLNEALQALWRAGSSGLPSPSFSLG